MMDNSNKKNWKRNQNVPATNTSKEKQCWRFNKKGTTQKNAGQRKTNSTANSAGLKDMYPKPARKKRPGITACPDLIIRIKRCK